MIIKYHKILFLNYFSPFILLLTSFINCNSSFSPTSADFLLFSLLGLLEVNFYIYLNNVQAEIFAKHPP